MSYYQAGNDRNHTQLSLQYQTLSNQTQFNFQLPNKIKSDRVCLRSTLFDNQTHNK